MLKPLGDVLASEAAAGRAVGAFTCYDTGTAIGVLDAAEAVGHGVALLVAERSLATPRATFLAGALIAIAERAAVDVAIQSDHVRTLELLARSFSLGLPSAMIDGSRLPINENVELANQAGAVARKHHGDIEAELGRIEGTEDVSTGARAGAMTNPDQVADFAGRTRLACLAVAVGNIHGEYTEPPRLDFARLEAIARESQVPLSLHGASGLSREDIRRSIRLGVRKFNVNTDLRAAIFATLETETPTFAPGYRVAELGDAVIAAVSRVAAAKLADFDPAG